MDPEKRICDRCGHKFDAVTPHQQTCTPCMTKPSTWGVEVAKTRKAEHVGYKEKTCGVCGKPYAPTGAAQKKCAECRGKAAQKKDPTTGIAEKLNAALLAMESGSLLEVAFSGGPYTVTISKTQG